MLLVMVRLVVEVVGKGDVRVKGQKVMCAVRRRRRCEWYYSDFV